MDNQTALVAGVAAGSARPELALAMVTFLVAGLIVVALQVSLVGIP